jgi:hypothetical protein
MDFTKKLVNNDLLRYAINYTLLSQAITYNREFLMKIDGFLSREILPQSEDYEFNIRVASKVKKYSIINKFLIRQNLREDSYSHSNLNRIQVWLSAVKALELNYNNIDSAYNDVIANKIYNCGVQLFRLGAYTESIVAFNKSRNFGKLSYEGRSFFYKLIVKIIGEFNAEKVSKWIN